MGKLYHKKRRVKKDLLAIPEALADFIPAAVMTVATPILPFALLWLCTRSLASKFSEWANLKIGTIDIDYEPPLPPPTVGMWIGAVLLVLIASPVIAAIAVITSALAAALMFLKATLSTALAGLTLITMPFKAIATAIAKKADLFKSHREEDVVEKVLEKAALITVSPALTSLTLSQSQADRMHTRYMENVMGEKDAGEALAYEQGTDVYAAYWLDRQKKVVAKKTQAVVGGGENSPPPRP